MKKIRYNDIMKRITFRTLQIIFIIFLMTESIFVRAEQKDYDEAVKAYVNDTDVIVRTGPGTNYAQMKVDGKYIYYPYNQQIDIIGEDYDKKNELWYRVKWMRNEQEIISWIRNDFVRIAYDYSDDDNYEDYLKGLNPNIPDGYIEKLVMIHNEHPEWIIEIYDTGLEWDTVIAKESRLGYNLIDGSNLCYRSTEPGAYDRETGKFIPLDGNNWFAANKETIAYYIDPRNFLDSKNIFMFCNLSFNQAETEEIIQKVINGTFMEGTDKVSGKKFSTIFYEAGKNADVSPVYLAALARQEQGNTGTRCVTGESFTYNNKTYSGLYNFYNIGATSGTDSWKKGLIYANGGEDGSATSYLRPWKSPYKAISGGAKFVASGYIDVGQDTMYFQKFNVTGYHTYSHQYQTNVRAAMSQGNIIYSAFRNADSLETKLTFTIPIFKNMPEKTELPTTYTLPEPDKPEDPIPDDEISGDPIVDLDLLNSSGYLTGFKLGQSYSEFKKQLEILESGKYSVVIRNREGQEINDEDILATGQTITFINGQEESNYKIIIKGDLNGDGKINAVDLLLMKKKILEVIEFDDLQNKAAHLSTSDKVSVKDYLVMKKHYLGVQNIEQ